MKKAGKANPIQVLIVEDNQANLDYLVTLIKEIGGKAYTAITGEEALELMEGKSVDCMLLDIALGRGMSGIELMHSFRESDAFKDIPMFAVTAHGASIWDEFIAAGFTDYLAKPYSLDQLKEMFGKYGLLSS